jgi:demethylmenaquinone methyltransferase/2-methoxy-6-polyprenyl-1,4-benzoquinol methylase
MKKVPFGYRQVPEQEKEHLVVEHFNTVARMYDRMNTLLSFGIHYLWKRKTVRMLKPAPGERVLDVCGGTADMAIMAGRTVGASGSVTLYDINRAMMEIGRAKVRRKALDNRIRFCRGDAEAIALRREQFDVVMVGFGVRNLTHMERGFAEMFRVMRRGGRFACLEFSVPTAPMFRWLYDLYSFHLMPLAGRVLVGSRRAYLYLPESIRRFPSPTELKAMLEGIGFAEVAYHKLTNGIAVIHRAVKP